MWWYRAALGTVWAIYPELSSSSTAKKVIACASSGFGMYFFSSKKAGLTQRGFAVLPGCVDAPALPIEVITQLKARSTFPMENLLELFRFIQSTLPGEEVLRAEERRTLWNPIVNTGIAAVDKPSINEGIACYLSTIPLLQEYLKEEDASVWVAKKNSSARRPARGESSVAPFRWRLQWQALNATIRGSIFADGKALCFRVRTQRLRNCHSWQMPCSHCDRNCRRASVCFRVSRLPAVRFL